MTPGRKAIATFLDALGGLGLLLASIGLYAVDAFAVARRSREIGIGNMDVYRPTIDPVALLAIAALTALVGVAAAFVPARRAAQMHPLAALRHE